MSDEEEWSGYHDDSSDEEEKRERSVSTTVSFDDERETVEPEVTENDLNFRAILVDGQTWLQGLRQPSLPPVTEISLVVLEHPLSECYAKETLRSLVVCQPSMKGTSRVLRAALAEGKKRRIANRVPRGKESCDSP